MECPAGFGIESYSTSFVIMMQYVMFFFSIRLFVCFYMLKALIGLLELLCLLNPPPQVYVVENSNLATKGPLVLLQRAITNRSQNDLRTDSREICALVCFLKHAFQVEALQAHPAREALCGLTFALKAHSLMRE